MFFMFLTHVKFRVDWILFTIRFIKLFFIHNFLDHKKLKVNHLIDNIVIKFFSSKIFCEYIRYKKKM